MRPAAAMEFKVFLSHVLGCISRRFNESIANLKTTTGLYHVRVKPK